MYNYSDSPTALSKTKPSGPHWVRAKSWLQLLLIFQFSILIPQCGLDIEDPTPPSPPQWVQKSLPEEWPERGIDAFEDGAIQLEWQVSENEENVRYIIYRAEYTALGDSLSEFARLKVLDDKNFETTTFVDEQVMEQTKYCYKIQAIDISNNISEYSDGCCYKIIGSVDINSMHPNGITPPLSETRLLSWYTVYMNIVQNYTITILDQDQRLIHRTSFTPHNYIIGEEEQYAIPDSVGLLFGQVYFWRIDTGAKYLNGYETAGAESQWATFQYYSTEAGYIDSL